MLFMLYITSCNIYFIHNSFTSYGGGANNQDMEEATMSIDIEMDKEDVVHICSEI